jgi:hypothetical protein
MRTLRTPNERKHQECGRELKGVLHLLLDDEEEEGGLCIEVRKL